MNDPTGGYITDLAYPGLFHRETSPVWMAAAVAAIGQQAPGLHSFRYLELGCGVGLNLALLAAANPGGRFVGVDVNPRHIAQGSVYAGLLSNLALVEAGFDQLAEQDAAFEAPFDFIVLHGVYSWIAPERQEMVRRLIRHWLAPGGLVYLHYTTHPGHSVFAGAQALLRRIADLTPGDSGAKLANGLAGIRALDAGGAGYLRAHPAVGNMLLHTNADAAYLAHDLLAPDWAALHVGDVIADMEMAECAFVGSATILENIDALSIPGAMQPLIARTPDIRLRETLRDLARNQSLRRDLYRRGLAGLRPEAYRAQLDALRFCALPTLREKGDLELAMSIGPVSVDAALVDPLRARLHQGPARFGELAALAPGGGAAALRALHMLIAAGEVHAMAPGPPSSMEAHALNRLITAREHRQTWVAAPMIGSAVPLDPAEASTLHVLLDDPSAPCDSPGTVRLWQALGILPR